MAGNKPCYVIMGSTGEYSDHNEWVVGFVLDEVEAQGIVQLYGALAREIFAGCDDYQERDEAADKLHPDPRCRMDYTGTRYWYETTYQITQESINESLEQIDRQSFRDRFGPKTPERYEPATLEQEIKAALFGDKSES